MCSHSRICEGRAHRGRMSTRTLVCQSIHPSCPPGIAVLFLDGFLAFLDVAGLFVTRAHSDDPLDCHRHQVPDSCSCSVWWPVPDPDSLPCVPCSLCLAACCGVVPARTTHHQLRSHDDGHLQAVLLWLSEHEAIHFLTVSCVPSLCSYLIMPVSFLHGSRARRSSDSSAAGGSGAGAGMKLFATASRC